MGKEVFALILVGGEKKERKGERHPLRPAAKRKRGDRLFRKCKVGEKDRLEPKKKVEGKKAVLTLRAGLNIWKKEGDLAYSPFLNQSRKEFRERRWGSDCFRHSEKRKL